MMLVSPPAYRVVERYYDRPPYPRTALASLAAFLRASGIDVCVLDCKFDRLDYSAAVEKIVSACPDVVGFTAFTNEIIQAAHLAELVKQQDPRITTVIGGVHVTALPEQTMREFTTFDFGVVGEGEETLVEFLQARRDGAEPQSIQGLCFLDTGGNFVAGPPRRRISDIDSLPMPAWDMFAPGREYGLQTSRGCPFVCPFCMNPHGRTVRPRSVEKVLDEIAWLVENRSPRNILICDEAFTIKRPRTMEICRGLIDRGLSDRIRWRCHTHVRSIDLEMVTLMKQAGCVEIGIGAESGNEEILAKTGKGITTTDIVSAAEILRQARMPFQAFFILGHPDETPQTAGETIDFAVRLNPTLPVFGIMVPYPGTEIGRMAAEGDGGYILQARDWNDYNKQLGNAVSIRGLERKTLERMQFRGYLKVFIRNRRFGDLLKFIWRYRREGIAMIAKSARRIFRRRSKDQPAD